MNTKEETQSKISNPSLHDFDAVGFMREQRDRITKDIMNLSPEEVVAYFERSEQKLDSKESSRS